MEDEVNIIVTRSVMVEKMPFYVSAFCSTLQKYGEPFIVRQCVSEDDLKEARKKYKGIFLDENLLTFNTMQYYYALSKNPFVGNVVSKTVCKRLSKTETIK